MDIKKYLLLMVSCLLLALSGQAQNTAIQGYIYDSQTRQPLAGVNITDINAQLLTHSDKKGYFTVPFAQTQNQIRAVMMGYKTQTITLGANESDLNIQLDADAVNLNEVRVTGFSDNKTNKETAGSVALVTAQDISRGNALSFQSAFNSIPGVRMDQSTLSEARISIRGNGVRSTFGIRNLKIYLNEIPITEADGTTRIEALDINSIGRAEIIKGPASSIYGAGTGGVINFSLQRAPYQEQSIEAAGLTGAYGLNRLATTYRSGGDKLNSYVSYGWQEYNGYRKHSTDMRKFITSNFQLFPSNKRIVTLLLNRTTQHSQIPGSLTQDQVSTNPVQANATNLDKAAGRYQNWTRIGLGQQYLFNDQFSNSTSVFTYFYDLNHPLPFAYIRNYYQSYGGRTKFRYDPEFTVLPTKFILGAEVNHGLTKGVQYVNNKGKEGSIISNIDYRNTQYSLFYQSETALSPKTTFALGLSYNGLNYDVQDYLINSRSGIKRFKGQFSPRVALSHNFSDAISLHGSISSGFSPPSSSEIRNADGSVNSSLQAEKGLNYEVNAKGNLFSSRIGYDLALFKLDMKGELIGQAIQQGITIYNNSGKTSHNGAELALSWQLIKSEDNKRIVALRPFASVTYSDFTFKDYKILNGQNQVTAAYDGNPLTGIAPWVVNTGIDLETRSGIYIYGSYYYSDNLPLNDAATAFNSSYHVLNSKIGYKKKLGKLLEMNIYGGLDNALNENYTSITSLNAVGFGGGQPAYFNPSPKRNGYGGLNIKYKF
jgi:iron complex outermembrane receptor protein